MKTIGAYEAKTRLSRVLRDVATQGEEYVIERRGRRMARIVPCDRKRKTVSSGARGIVEAFRRIRASVKPGPAFDFKAMITEGRKR
jgi:prevent-host-death family protein